MTKIEEHADHLLNAAADLRIAVKAKRWDEARQHAASVSKHRSVIIAIIEAVEELQPKTSAPQQKRRYPLGHKRPGDLSRYIREQIRDMKPGDQSIVKPQGEFTLDRLRNTVASVAGRLWGYGNYVTAWRPDGIEVMRLE